MDGPDYAALGNARAAFPATVAAMAHDTSSTQDLPVDGINGAHHPGHEALTVAHVSDTHIGAKQYDVNASSGRNQREQDFSRALLSNVLAISEWDPALVIHSGDAFDNPRPSWRHMMQMLDATQKLSEDNRILVIAAGNHDMPADATEPCPLELFDHLPNVIVATNRYRVVDLGEYVAQGIGRPELANVVVHLLPHEALKGAVWEDVEPIPGKTNILVSHCVVGGSELYKRAVGREYALPIDVITRGWDYVALGHYHKQGPVAVGGYSTATTPAWYAGSTENNGFSDVKDNKTSGGRGYLQVRLTPGETVPDVRPVDLPIRAMFRLPVIDAKGLGHQEITTKMLETVAASEVTGAVVRQIVDNVHPDTWALVDTAAAKAAAKAAMWYEAKPNFPESVEQSQGESEDTERLGDLGAVLGDVLAETFGDDPHREAVEALARQLLGSALDAPAAPESCCGGDDTEEHAAHGTRAPRAA